jgi:Glycosyl hydrolase family 26
MKSRLVMLMALAVAALSVTIASSRFTYKLAPAPAVHAKLAPRQSSYLGVFESPTPSSYQQIAGFGRLAGRLPNLAGYYSGWAEPFDTRFANALHAHHITPFVQIDPSHASVDAIADGTYDDYLTQYADSVRAFGHAVVIGFGHEMNAPGNSWGYGHVKPSDFIAAWRHLVRLFDQQGADNVTWIWTVAADQPGTGPVKQWWPGSAYVDWVGLDGFYYRPTDTFATVFGPMIRSIRRFAPRTPMLLSETAVGPRAGQLPGILNLFGGMAKAGTLGLVWFDIDQDDGIYHQDWRLENDQVGQNAIRLAVREDLSSS